MKFGSIIDNWSSLLPSNLQKRFICYALQKILRPFLRKDINADDLELQVGSGRISFSNLDVRIESAPFFVSSGSIEELEITIPWADLLSVKATIIVRGLRIHIRPHTARDALSNSTTLTESIAYVTESFLEEEDDEDVGIGADKAEPALLQRFLDSVIASLSLSLIDSNITLEAQEADHDIELHIGNIVCSGEQGDGTRQIDTKDIAINLRVSEQSHARSSRSTSLSSTDHEDLMQSTIFGKDEGRSLYMSALSSPSAYYSAIQERDASDHRIVDCNAGCRALLRGSVLEVSIEELRAVLGRPQLQTLYSFLSEYRIEPAEPETSPNMLMVKLRLRTLSLDVDLLNDASLEHKIQPASTISLLLHRIAIGTEDLAVDSCQVHVGGHCILSAKTEFLKLQFSILEASLCALKLDLPIQTLQRLLTDLAGMTPRTEPSDQSLAEQTFRLSCPSVLIDLLYHDERSSLQFDHIAAVYTTKPTSRRFGLEFASFKATALHSNLSSNSATTFDITWPGAKQAQRKLDFVDYKTVFTHPEKDYQSDQATLHAIQQRSKGTANVVCRVSLGDLCCNLAPLELISKLDTTTSASQKIISWTSVFFVDIKSISTEFAACDWSYSTVLKGINCFYVQNVRSVDILTANVIQIGFSARHDSETINIVSIGLHTSLTEHKRSLPMVTLRWRKSISTMARLGLTDVSFNYSAEMPWLTPLQSLVGAESAETQPPSLSFALDLLNVCISLTPYTTSSKALLYFRNSAIQGTVGRPLTIRPGVADLFLIDNIEGGQNDLNNGRRVRNDPIASPLIKLGFVHVASLETVEVDLRTETPITIDITGAILTLNTCADSTQTLITLIGLLRLPVVISDELKYRLGLNDLGEVPLDVFEGIEEDAFKATETIVLSDEDELELSAIDEQLLSQSVLAIPKPPQMRLRAKNCFFVWNLYDGYDWEGTRSEISTAIEAAVEKAQKPEEDGSESTDSNEIGDLLFNSIYIALPNGSRPEDITEAINKELAQADDETASHTTARPSIELKRQELAIGRSKAHKARIEVSGIVLGLEVLSAEEGEILNRVDVDIGEFEIIDNVSTSTWRKFITQARSSESRSIGMIHIQTIRPVPGLAAAELIVKADIAPLRLHVDQDTLEFLTRFFEFKLPVIIPPVPADEIFIQRFEIMPIKVQIDYKPKRVDFKSLRSGRTTEFKNFFILEESNMILKHVVLYGICGFPRVFSLLNDIWMAHVKSKQLGSVLAGVSPLRSLASFGGGLRDLVMVPITEYRKDGRLGPGLQKGLTSFARSTGQEAIRLGTKLAVGTQGLLESTEAMLVPSSEAHHTTSMYANQPANLRQGVSQAITGMTRNMIVAKQAIAALPRDMEDPERTLRAASKSVPVAVLRPLIGTTEMISKTLMGLRNTMNPEQRRLNEDKYK